MLYQAGQLTGAWYGGIILQVMLALWVEPRPSTQHSSRRNGSPPALRGSSLCLCIMTGIGLALVLVSVIPTCLICPQLPSPISPSPTPPRPTLSLLLASHTPLAPPPGTPGWLTLPRSHIKAVPGIQRGKMVEERTATEMHRLTLAHISIHSLSSFLSPCLLLRCHSRVETIGFLNLV